jgi:hypothetical protein
MKITRRKGIAWRAGGGHPHIPERHEIHDCFSKIEGSLQGIERAVGRLKSEAALLRVEGALNEAPLVPSAQPIRERVTAKRKLVFGW